MKIYFERPSSKWALDSGYVNKWDRVIGQLQHHPGIASITSDPLNADVHILNSREQLDDHSLRHYLRPLLREDVRSIVWDWGDRPTGRLSGFYCSLHPILYNPLRHRAMHYPVPFNEDVEFFPFCDAVQDFGFIGGITSPLRRKIVEVMSKNNNNWNNFSLLVDGMDWNKTFSGLMPLSFSRQYVEFLRRTRFVICPRGYGLGSSRLFETMKAGRVPIIISDSYILPSGIDWKSCSIRLPERCISRVGEIVSSYLPDWQFMAANARRIWEYHFSPENTLRYFSEQINALSHNVNHFGPISMAQYTVNLSFMVARERLGPRLASARSMFNLNVNSGRI